MPTSGNRTAKRWAAATRREASRCADTSDLVIANMFVSYSLSRPIQVTWLRCPGVVNQALRISGPDALVMVGVRLLTPPVREIYALLVQAGIVVVDD